MADAYEEYRIKGMVWEYKSTSGEFVTNGAGSSNGALGTVIMATNYNAAISPAFLDKKSMENYEHAQSGPPTRNIMHALESKGAGTPVKTLYLRNTAAPTGTDKRLYDIGTFVIATQGMQTDVGISTIGELWVAYEVEFFKPKYRPGGGKADHFALRYDAANPAGNNLVGGMTNANPFGTAARIDRTNPATGANNPNNGAFAAGSYIVNSTGVKSTIVLPQNPGGWYMIRIWTRSATGALSTAIVPTFTRTYNACTLVNNWNKNWTGSTTQAPDPGVTTTGASWMHEFCVQANPPDNGVLSSVDITINQAPTATAYMVDVFVEEVNPDIYTNPSA